MIVKLRLIALLALGSLSLAGCAAKEIFDCCDRYCYLADWPNHHSCISCCPNTGYCDPPIVDFSPECQR
jgi:hypothetical protein